MPDNGEENEKGLRNYAVSTTYTVGWFDNNDNYYPEWKCGWYILENWTKFCFSLTLINFG